jgi:predicted nucleic-acid-binding protein
VIALDTNIVLRTIVKDDPAQWRRADALLARTEASGLTLFVPTIVICEVVWTLARTYRYRRPDIATTIRELLATRFLEIERPDEVRAALAAFECGGGDFADYLIRERALAAGCADVRTFDEDLLAEAGFAPPEADLGPSGVAERGARYGTARRRRVPRRR